jgi:TPR repeat protein/outer membrane biosynthesis protein TonB
MRKLAMMWLLLVAALIASPAAAVSGKAKNLKPYISVSWGEHHNAPPSETRSPPLRSARPATNADSWFPESEYPPEALAKELAGSAVLDVRLDATGKIIVCTLAEVKGDLLLHRSACQTVQKRGQFLAELDNSGVAKAATVRMQIYWGVYDPDMLAKAPDMNRTRGVDFHYPDPEHWRPAANSLYGSLSDIDWSKHYPDTAGLPAMASTGVDMIILPDGAVSDCQVRRPSKSDALDQAGCNAVKTARATFKYGKPAKDTKISADIHWKGKSATLELADHGKSSGPRLSAAIEIAENDRPAGPAPRFAETHVELTVGLDGKALGCTIYRSSNSDAYDRKSCALLRERAVFESARNTLGGPTYGDTRLVLNWTGLFAYWPTDYSASFDEEVMACKMGQVASCTTAGNARLGGYWARKSETVAYDPDDAIALLKTGCKGNATQSCRRLGEVYRAGKDTPASPTFAAYYLDLACKGVEGYSDDQACVAYAEMLMNSEGITPDQVRAFKLFEGACSGWRDAGCLGLGKAYENGTGVAADIQKAIEIYSANCQQYKTRTCLALEKLYFTGKGVAQDKPRAVAYFEKTCRSSAMSKTANEPCLLAGIAFLDGSGVAADIRKGAGYLNIACNSGIADGCARLGNVVREGLLGKVDESVSIRLWKQALAFEPGNSIAVAAMRKHKVDPERD